MGLWKTFSKQELAETSPESKWIFIYLLLLAWGNADREMQVMILMSINFFPYLYSRSELVFLKTQQPCLIPSLGLTFKPGWTRFQVSFVSLEVENMPQNLGLMGLSHFSSKFASRAPLINMKCEVEHWLLWCE